MKKNWPNLRSYKMELDKDAKDKIAQAVKPIVTSALATALVAGAAAALAALLVTNYKKSGLTGETEMHPTTDEMNMSKVETSAKDTDASLGKDEVTAKDGDLSANRTDAAASSGEATAAESGATAARTKAGAADIETKALKMT
jgi:hypothetical protein